LAVQKIDVYIAKQCSHVEFPHFGIQINSKKPGFGRKNQLRMW
jgi:hypothetical protein